MDDKEFQLLNAVLNGNIDQVDSILKNKVDTNFVFAGQSIIHFATQSVIKDPDFRIIKKLLEHGANINSKDQNGTTALHISSKSNNPSLGKFLLENGADKTIKDKSGKLAIDYSRSETMKNLLLGKPVKITSEENELRVKPIDILEKAGIPISGKGSKYGMVTRDEIIISDDTTKHDTILYQDNTLDYTWFKKQYDFLKGLTEQERLLLRAYTSIGDRIANSLFRFHGKELTTTLMKHFNEFKGKSNAINIFYPVNLSDITEDNIITHVSEYVNNITKIFERAPKIETPFRVSRGVKLGDPPNLQNPPFTGIVSTSYALYGEGGILYIQEITNQKDIDLCCVYDIILQPGVSAIWLSPVAHLGAMEHEIILLESMVKVSFSKPKVKKGFKNINDPPLNVLTYDTIVTPVSKKGGKTRRYKRKHRKTFKK